MTEPRKPGRPPSRGPTVGVIARLSPKAKALLDKLQKSLGGSQGDVLEAALGSLQRELVAGRAELAALEAKLGGKIVAVYDAKPKKKKRKAEE